GDLFQQLAEIQTFFGIAVVHELSADFPRLGIRIDLHVIDLSDVVVWPWINYRFFRFDRNSEELRLVWARRSLLEFLYVEPFAESFLDSFDIDAHCFDSCFVDDKLL